VTVKSLDSGILLIDKPEDITSFAVVSRARKILGIKRVGHLGTLDPFATGVLPLAFNKATRLAQYLLEHDKIYQVTVELGLATDTMDKKGEVIASTPLTREYMEFLLAGDRREIKAAVASLIGSSKQLPPMYSAVKVAGKPLYYYARRGEQVAYAARDVVVFSAELLDVVKTYSHLKPELETLRLVLRIHCSKGTYIRVLADELGRRLGNVAYAVELRRLAVGGFVLENAVGLETLEDLYFTKLAGDSQALLKYLFSRGNIIKMEQAMQSYPLYDLSWKEARAIAAGRAIKRQDKFSAPGLSSASNALRAESDSVRQILGLLWQGKLLAVGQCEVLAEGDCLIRPKTVFVTSQELESEGMEFEL